MNTIIIPTWNMDIYKTWTGVHGPLHGPGPWTTPWAQSMDPVHGPPLIFKRKSPLIIWKFTGGQGMKNTYSYLLLTSLRVCLIIEGCFESKALQSELCYPATYPLQGHASFNTKTKKTLCSSIKITSYPLNFFINIPWLQSCVCRFVVVFVGLTSFIK